MKTVPFWIDDHPGRAYQRPNELPRRVDVAVVGAGYTGLACALGVAKAGSSVVVIDKGSVGAGASSVNGGQLCPGLKKSPQQLFDLYGRELGRRLWDASVEAVHAVERLIEEESIDCGYEATGGLSLAYKPHHFERQQRYAEWLQREIGYEREAIPKDRIRDEIGSDLYHGGLLDRRGGGLHPAAFVHGLAEAAERAGAQIVEQVEVVDIQDADGRHRLTLDTGETLDADEV
ncbi:MAG: FAD-dependent oxidoreductase, partial [Acidobacteriota bacterium]